MKRAVVIMAKQPISGASKTRLTPTLTSEEAAELALAFLLDSANLVRSLAAVTPTVAAAPAGSEHFFRKTMPDFEVVSQIGESLAERLNGVMRTGLEDFDQVFAINADSPSLPQGHLIKALALLDDDSVDVVFGPSSDGGYYLIGWKQAHNEIISSVEMSTSTVLADTLVLAASQGLTVALAPEWFDVDEPADLDRLKSDIDAGIPCGPYTAAWLTKHQ
jgi:rSAM/selenodomain-associated transferase 1